MNVNDILKQKAAKAALEYVGNEQVLGIGTGSTVNFFIQELAKIKHRIDACIASSVDTAKRLQALGIPVIDLNSVTEIPLYIDSADEINQYGVMLKGGGGALTREKLVASVSKQFICIVNESKIVNNLGMEFPIVVEVLPMARSLVARELVKLNASPAYRAGFITDNGNIILDVHNIKILTPIKLEEELKLIPGVIESGLFAKRAADCIISANPHDIKIRIVNQKMD